MIMWRGCDGGVVVVVVVMVLWGSGAAGVTVGKVHHGVVMVVWW